ncbi:DUF3995 domain-containing protein [Flavobacterium ustbae]|uniref:DUF3995 domain-containing protein n=1 Tax=Flavobacterium ustbae TaxID=2488790 RepID=UPI000F79C31E|nr:DUF3995 domain-containing protein [Flavobacterium ustbae]
MAKIIALVLFSIFLFLSLVHFYWAFGGKCGTQGVYPTLDAQTPSKNPGIIPTLIVAIGLLAFAFFYLIRVKIILFKLPFWIEKYGLWILMSIFILRSIGDFKYLGFFKRIKKTNFGQNDTKYFVPLCLIISVMTFLIIILN